ncbi:peptidoglycan DD-metalloendopeptidase family protein [Melioribacteraceae bacterium 4301-Me]|uniref:M23 family metallopeptidase n=1 Tax=Pyranulibacter aquaticus TaxID=3163344 RepID=UPI00359530B0
MIAFFSSCNKKEEPSLQLNTEKHKISPFGFVADSLEEERGVIGNNETLTDILLPYGVPYEKIYQIAQKSKDVFYVRKFKTGDNYVIYKTNDTIPEVKYFIYEKDIVNYVVFDLSDPIKIYEGKKRTEVKEMFADGVINSSLYETFENNNLDINLALKLADVFAWQIDFYRIQKGDKFKVFYEEEYLNNEPIGVGKIIAAEFSANNQNYFAFRFEQNGSDVYFDEKGNSLRKAFLKAPLKFSRITSRYSLKRYHPILHREKAHLGTDYAAPTGTPILSVGDGIVTEATYKAYNGNYVKIRHNSTYSTQYLHMSKIAKGIKPGVRVKQGQVIGYVGSTGLATGPHVCFRFWKNGRQVDPFREKIPPSKPIDPKNREAFFTLRDELLKKLNSASNQNDSTYAMRKGSNENNIQ